MCQEHRLALQHEGVVDVDVADGRETVEAEGRLGACGVDHVAEPVVLAVAAAQRQLGGPPFELVETRRRAAERTGGCRRHLPRLEQLRHVQRQSAATPDIASSQSAASFAQAGSTSNCRRLASLNDRSFESAAMRARAAVASIARSSKSQSR